jgi:hypothetical protein
MAHQTFVRRKKWIQALSILQVKTGMEWKQKNTISGRRRWRSGDVIEIGRG